MFIQPGPPLVDGFTAPQSLARSIIRPDGGYSGAGIRDKNGKLIYRRGFAPQQQNGIPDQQQYPTPMLPGSVTQMPPVLMPQNPSQQGQIPPLAHLRQAMTQLHAMQMAQRMAKHSVLHGGG